jgi:hypothetical protein
MNRKIWIAALGIAMSTSSPPAQNLNSPIGTGAVILALPCAGLPISLEQREELLLGLMMIERSAAAGLLRKSGASLTLLKEKVSTLKQGEGQKGNDGWSEGLPLS